MDPEELEIILKFHGYDSLPEFLPPCDKTVDCRCLFHDPECIMGRRINYILKKRRAKENKEN